MNLRVMKIPPEGALTTRVAALHTHPMTIMITNRKPLASHWLRLRKATAAIAGR